MPQPPSAPAKHRNTGACLECAEIFKAYPNFNPQLKAWFLAFQNFNKEAHISCAGRGFKAQEEALKAKRSRAPFGESAHNWGCAIDIFVLIQGRDIYFEKWFTDVLAPTVPHFLNWYGAPGSVYYERPHIELREWRALRARGEITLVEPVPTLNEGVA